MKKKKKVHVMEATYQELLKEYINEVVKQQVKTYHSELEPFEVYAEKLQRAIVGDFTDFHNSFLNGYMVLMEQLKKTQK